MYFLIIIIFLVAVLEISYKLLNKKKKIKDLNIKRISGLNLIRNYSIFSETNHSQNSKKCSELGWDLEENSHINVKVNIPYFEKEDSINYKLNDIAARSNIQITKNSDLKEFIGFFGCSITYGHGLNEEDTYPFKLSNKLENINYLNFAVPGYSTYQSLIKFKKKLKHVNFKTVVLGIHRDLERRNTCSISWSKIINNYWGIPSTIKFKNLNFHFKPKYRTESKINLFSIKFLLEIFNLIKFSPGSLKYVQKQTQKKLLLEFKKLCEENKIELIILCLDNYNEIFNFLTKNNFNWTTSNISLSEKNEKDEYIWQKMPWDNHPNSEANEIFANQLSKVLKSNKRPYVPEIKNNNNKVNDQEYIYPLW
jgi:hypothetical protein